MARSQNHRPGRGQKTHAGTAERPHPSGAVQPGPAPDWDNFDGYRCPFLYSTNGEIIWFHDVRHRLHRSRQVAAFHTPGALRELLLTRDFDAAAARLLGMQHDHPMLRPYQLEANAAIERAIAERK